MVKQEFTALFKGYKIPKELKNLLEFQVSENIPSYYSNAIYLMTEETSLIENYSTDEAFLKAFIPFAEANSSGSIYAFWIENTEIEDLTNAPIVAFGDEGGIFVVARNIQELLQIAAYDVEAVVYEDEFYFQDKEVLEEEGEFVAAEFNMEYLDWLRSDAKLKPVLTIDGVDAIVDKAQVAYQEKLEQYIKRFI
ncbi:cell wall assembly protein [Myroides sp. WP-1]|uniref:cell wall assembly protein n=1 Tax=Myroides sp. WP-1 TaxID=2759944 RepID=UPI0015F85865|nr:cell wall assembly protein [Myroides sp. WP-1]MBB1140788.1 cell wall assembly protein [Myroides sp. WP-1]